MAGTDIADTWVGMRNETVSGAEISGKGKKDEINAVLSIMYFF